jgi:hypothetical protein
MKPLADSHLGFNRATFLTFHFSGLVLSGDMLSQFLEHQRLDASL